MSMSTRAVGFRPPDAAWQKHMAVYDACQAAGVQVPEETEDFFGDDGPDPNGQHTDIDAACEDWHSEMQAGIQVDLTKLPKNLRYIRFINNW